MSQHNTNNMHALNLQQVMSPNQREQGETTAASAAVEENNAMVVEESAQAETSLLMSSVPGTMVQQPIMVSSLNNTQDHSGQGNSGMSVHACEGNSGMTHSHATSINTTTRQQFAAQKKQKLDELQSSMSTEQKLQLYELMHMKDQELIESYSSSQSVGSKRKRELDEEKSFEGSSVTSSGSSSSSSSSTTSNVNYNNAPPKFKHITEQRAIKSYPKLVMKNIHDSTAFFSWKEEIVMKFINRGEAWNRILTTGKLTTVSNNTVNSTPEIIKKCTSTDGTVRNELSMLWVEYDKSVNGMIKETLLELLDDKTNKLHEWCRKKCMNQIDSANKIWNELCSTYTQKPEQVLSNYRHQLNDARQKPTETTKQFMDRVEELIYKISSMDGSTDQEKKRWEAAKKMLKQHHGPVITFEEKFTKGEINAFTDMMEFIRKLEQMEQSANEATSTNSSSDKHPVNQMSDRNNRRCDICQRDNHKTEDCYRNPANKKKNDSGYRSSGNNKGSWKKKFGRGDNTDGKSAMPTCSEILTSDAERMNENVSVSQQLF